MRIDQPENGLPGLHPLVIVDVSVLDDARERSLELGVLEQVERIVVSRPGLRETGAGRLGILPRNGL